MGNFPHKELTDPNQQRILSTGQINPHHPENYIDETFFNSLLNAATTNNDREKVENLIEVRERVFEQLRIHSTAMMQGQSTPSQQRGQQGQTHWSHNDILRWIHIATEQTQKQLRARKIPAKSSSPQIGYQFCSLKTVQATNKGTIFGDISFNTDRGCGYLFPHCVGMYYEPQDPITLNEMVELVDHVQQEITRQILQKTGKTELTEHMKRSVNQINVESVAGFLLKDSMNEFINTLPNMDQSWLYLKCIVGFKNHTDYAFVWIPTPTDYLSNQWKSDGAKYPPITPDSPTIRAAIKKFTNLKQTGFAFPDETKENVYHFVLSNSYRRYFVSKFWNEKKKNECFLRWDEKNDKLVKVKPGKKGQYKFLKLPKPV